MAVVFIIALVAALLVAMGKFGVDTRPGFDERPETVRFGPLS